MATLIIPRPDPELFEPPPRELHMTEEEFVEWCDEDARAEWVDGKVEFMAPISGEHDSLQWWLGNLLQFYVEARDAGAVKGPEFQIRLIRRRRRSRRQPDVLYISKQRLHHLTANHLDGPPDLILEIVSQASQSRDRREKYEDYESAGVRENWIVDPLSQVIEAYALDRKGNYQPIKPKEDDSLHSTVVRGWYLRAQWLFGPKRANVLDALAELGVRQQSA